MSSGPSNGMGPPGGFGRMDLIPAAHRGEVSNPTNDEAEEVKRACCDQEHRTDQPLRPSGAPKLARRRPLDISEAAAYLNVSDRYVRRLVAERRVPYLKVGRLVRFRPEDLDSYLETCLIQPVDRR